MVMRLKDRAVEARLLKIERTLVSTGHLFKSASAKGDAGDQKAGAVAEAMLHKQRLLVEQTADIHPVSPIGLAAKARIAGHHLDMPTAGRVVVRSLVEDLHALEPLRRR